MDYAYVFDVYKKEDHLKTFMDYQPSVPKEYFIIPYSTIIIGFNIQNYTYNNFIRSNLYEDNMCHKYIDLWVEAKQLMLSHPEYYSVNMDLQACVKIFNLDFHEDCEKFKNAIEHGDEEYIDDYGKAYLSMLKELHQKINRIHQQINDENSEFRRGLPLFKLDDILRRGKYAAVCGMMNYKSKGIPIDLDLTSHIYHNLETIKRDAMIEANTKMGFEVFQSKYKKKNDTMRLDMQTLADYISSKDVKLETTQKGNLKFSDEFLMNHKDKLKDYIEIKSILKQLEAISFYEQHYKDPEGNAYIRVKSHPFHQKTGRSGHLPSKGHILSMPSWTRFLIVPHAGEVLVQADFKEQEVLIAASLSNDQKMLDAYGNIYLQTAIDLGFAPVNATKESHYEIRDLFKKITLSVIYGASEYSLAPTLKKYLKLTESEANEKANYLMAKHLKVYSNFWKFIYNHYNMAKIREYYQCPVSNWVYFLNNYTKKSQIQNVPMATHSSEMKRNAIIKAFKRGLNIITDQHDSLLMMSSKENYSRDADVLTEVMKEASSEILNNNKMLIEMNIVHEGQRLYSEKGSHIFSKITGIKSLESNETYIVGGSTI